MYVACSFPLPEVPINGCLHQTIAPTRGVLNPLVPPAPAPQPSSGVLPAGNPQQHDPVPVRWQQQPYLYHHQEKTGILSFIYLLSFYSFIYYLFIIFY